MSMVLQFQREIFNYDLANEIMDICGEHFIESDPFPGLTSKDYRDSDYFYELEAVGFLRLFTARCNNKLAGYGVFIVGDHPHYARSLQAIQDAFFLSKEYRQGWNGIKFLRYCDKHLVLEGCDVGYHYSPLRNDIGVVLKRIGYRPIQVLYARYFK